MDRRPLLMLATVVACSAQPDSATTTAAERAPRISPTVTATTITPAPAAPAPPPPDTGMISPDSALPPPSYPSIPGWLVMGGRGFPRHIGDSTDTDPRAYTGVSIDSGIIVFPNDARWGSVGTGTALALLVPNGRVMLYPGGAAEDDAFTPATLLRARALPAVEVTHLPISWLLPAGQSAAMTQLVVNDSVAPDSSTRTWTMDSVHFRLRLTGRTTAALWAAHTGGDSVRIGGAQVRPADDAHMGVDSDSIITLDNWRMPVIVAAFRLGDRWPVVAVVYFSGYECANYSVVVVRASSIGTIDEPHYYECEH